MTWYLTSAAAYLCFFYGIWFQCPRARPQGGFWAYAAWIPLSLAWPLTTIVLIGMICGELVRREDKKDEREQGNAGTGGMGGAV